MTDKPKPQRLSDVVKPGVDFAEKVKIDAVLDKEVLITALEKVSGSPEFNLIDPETGEITSRDYWNVEVELDGLLYTFSTGAVPLNKKFVSVQHKIDSGEAHYPLIATFSKSGRTYVVS